MARRNAADRMAWALAAAALLLGGCGGEDDPPARDGGCGIVCGEGQVCVDGRCVSEGGPDADGDGVNDGLDRCASSPPGERVDRSGCTLEQATVPLPQGPWGVGIRDPAGDFTVQTLEGSWSLHASWTGRDSYLFLVHQASNEYSAGLWNSRPGRLFAESPPNVHYFFLDTSATEGERRAALEELKGRVDEDLATLGTADQWSGRVHYVTDSVTALDGALGAFFAAHPQFAFAIDRFGRWREVGLLVDMTRGGSVPEMRFLAAEARGFEYERRLAWQLDTFDATEVVVFDGDRHAGGWEEGYATDVEIELPSAAEMARFDSMAVHLYTACPEHLQGRDAGCNEWDYAHHLFLCDADDPSRCETELVRYVTPYGREGEWLTDVSELLPLFADGGRRTLRYAGANGYDMHLRILLWDAGKPYRPVELTFLWGESGPIRWDLDYNGRMEPVRFTVTDPATAKMAIYNVVTGHGFGSTPENCAEFCNSQHEFTVNGTAFVEEHLDASTRWGCFDRIEEGVVPNQFGTWPFGRAGWCPGQDVKPWVQDISSALVSGENTIAYRALFRGEPYDPQPSGEGTTPELRLQTWLVRYAAR